MLELRRRQLELSSSMKGVQLLDYLIDYQFR